MSDPRRSGGGSWSIAGAVASLILLSIILPAGFLFIGMLSSAPFFGVPPSQAERVVSAQWLWVAFALSAASVIVIIALAVENRRHVGISALGVMSVLAVGAAGIWLIIALSSQRASDAEISPGSQAASPSPAPTIVMGRYIPEDQGIITATALIKRLGSAEFPADAGPGVVKQRVAGAGGDHPEVRGSSGNVAVGVLVGHRTCVLGEVRAGQATWSVAGLSDDGGCLSPEHT